MIIAFVAPITRHDSQNPDTVPRTVNKTDDWSMVKSCSITYLSAMLWLLGLMREPPLNLVYCKQSTSCAFVLYTALHTCAVQYVRLRGSDR